MSFSVRAGVQQTTVADLQLMWLWLQTIQTLCPVSGTHSTSVYKKKVGDTENTASHHYIIWLSEQGDTQNTVAVLQLMWLYMSQNWFQIIETLCPVSGTRSTTVSRKKVGGHREHSLSSFCHLLVWAGGHTEYSCCSSTNVILANTLWCVRDT